MKSYILIGIIDLLITKDQILNYWNIMGPFLLLLEQVLWCNFNLAA